MWRTSLAIPALEGPGLLQRPDERASVRGGVVALHGASLPQRDQPLFQHLAQILTPLGYAVLSYDRRSASDGNDTPLEVQAEDALAAVATLAAEIHAPVGLYGFSQGAWAAALAASASENVSFLVLLGSCGVSPAVQMRFYTDELLRRAGYDDAARAQLRALRLAVEDVLRGQGDRDATAGLLAAGASEPWFPLAYLHPELPTPDEQWHDMDYDPEPTFRGVSCPTLLIYGADEECVPAEASKQAWRRAARDAGNPEPAIVDLPGCGHFPAPAEASADLDFPVSDISPEYAVALEWVGRTTW